MANNTGQTREVDGIESTRTEKETQRPQWQESMKYGKLEKNTWKQVLHDGFAECMRVLKPYGTLIFKWNETQIPAKDVIASIGYEPLYGNRCGKQGKTHWMAFMKIE